MPTLLTPIPLVERLQAMLTAAVAHSNFRGPPFSISDLSPQELGQIWPDVLAARTAPRASLRYQTSSVIAQQVRELGRQPALDEAASLAVFAQLHDAGQAWQHLRWISCPPFAELAAHIRRILAGFESTEPSARISYREMALALWVDQEAQQRARQRFHTRYANSPLLLQEFALLPQLSLASIDALNHEIEVWGQSSAHQLQHDAAYLAFVPQVLKQALQRLQAVHAGAVPYSADCAFSVDDSNVLARAVRVAALRDDACLATLLPAIFALTVVAPNAKVKTLPSQSLALKLAQVMAEVPTPEGVQALLAAYAVVRHAGVKKKMERYLKPAQRGLGRCRNVLARLLQLASTTSQEAPCKPCSKERKQQQTSLVHCLEASFWQPFALPFHAWRAAMLATESGTEMARKLIWCTRQGEVVRSFMLAQGKLHDVEGNLVQLEDETLIQLWHPLLAGEDERRLWQAHISRHKIRQPIRQAYREFYRLPAAQLQGTDSDIFAGHVLHANCLLGLARKEGWKLVRDSGLTRPFGEFIACFAVSGEFAPGAQGFCASHQLHFTRMGGARPIALQEVPILVLSEVCRALDLLVSVTSFALEQQTAMPYASNDVNFGSALDNEVPKSCKQSRLARRCRVTALANINLNQMAQMRRIVLEHTFARQIHAEALQLLGPSFTTKITRPSSSS
ncbi:MAG: DUF4132 domain-containing protein [Burkholderiales bacterium]|nr:DUF4132 domain-containing protein [Burkholderiales bacterium]